MSGPSVDQDPSDWRSGYAAGLAGKPSTCPPDILDQLAWQSGEGEAAARIGWEPDEPGDSETDF